MSIKLKTLSICGVLAGALFIYLGLSAEKEAALLAEQGVSVPGKIVEADITRGRKNKKTYRLSVNWQEANGTDHPGQRFLVKKAFFQEKVAGETAIKSADVTVRYLNGHTADAIIVGGSSDFTGMQYLGYVLALIGGYGVLRGFVLR